MRYDSLFVLLVCLGFFEFQVRAETLKIKQDNSFFTRFRGVDSVYRSGELIWFTKLGGEHIASRRWQVKVNPIRPFRFSRKIKLLEQNKPVESRQIMVIEKSRSLLILDSYRWVMYAYDLDSLKLRSKGSIVIDRVSPAVDRGGEAPSWEVRDTRGKVEKIFRELRRQKVIRKIYGISHLPPDWAIAENPGQSEREYKYFLIGIQSQQFPLGILSCDLEQLSRCRLDRVCELEGTPLKTELAGLAIHKDSRSVFIGQSEQHQIKRYRWNSCLDVIPDGSVAIDRKWKKLSSLHIDEDNHLWLTASKIDDYFNSNITRIREENYLSLFRKSTNKKNLTRAD